MEERMKLEYRYLSEKRAAEIDALGLTDPYGKKISINNAESVTNEQETIIFQKIYHAHFYNIDNDCDQYLLFYKGQHYFLKIEDRFRKEIKDGETFFYFKFVVNSTIQSFVDCPSEEVLSVLKDVLYEYGRHRGWNTVLGMDIPMEIIYLGEKIYG